jgi:hypothetical protein
VQPSAPAADAGAAADEGAVTLTYMASQGWIKDAELELAKKFEEETGIHVDYQIIPADQYFSVLKTKLNSGEATDIFGGQSGKTDLQVQYDVEKNAVDLSGEEWVARHDPLSLEMVSLNGKVYGAEIWDTIASNYFIVVYNKDIFADARAERAVQLRRVQRHLSGAQGRRHQPDLPADFGWLAPRAVVPDGRPALRGSSIPAWPNSSTPTSQVRRSAGDGRGDDAAQGTVRPGLLWRQRALRRLR